MTGKNPANADLTPFGKCIADGIPYFRELNHLKLEYQRIGYEPMKADHFAQSEMATPKLRARVANTRDFMLAFADIGDIIASMQSYDPANAMRQNPLHVVLDDCILKHTIPYRSSEALRTAAIKPEKAARFR